MTWRIVILTLLVLAALGCTGCTGQATLGWGPQGTEYNTQHNPSSSYQPPMAMDPPGADKGFWHDLNLR